MLVTPMILGFTGPKGLGTALTIAGVGLLTGSLTMTAWGGPKRRLSGLLFFELLSAGAFCLMGLRPNLLLVAGAAFLAHWTLAFVSSLTEAIWQSQVSPQALGRILALKQTAVKVGTLCAYSLGWVLADRFLDTLLQPGSALSGSLGLWFGVGPGRGIAMLFFGIGLIKAVSVMWIFAAPGTRQLERDLVGPHGASHEAEAAVLHRNAG